MRRSRSEAELHEALRSLHVSEDVVLWEALDNTITDQPVATTSELSDAALRSMKARPHLWSHRNKRQYRWALFRTREVSL